MSDEEKKGGEELTVWGAVGPNGHVVKSSIGIFKAVANRWALRRGNYEVVKLGTIKSPAMETPREATDEGRDQKPQRMRRDVRKPGTRKRGRPSKADIAAREAAARRNEEQAS